MDIAALKAELVAGHPETGSYDDDAVAEVAGTRAHGGSE